jgi:hypothetical protein
VYYKCLLSITIKVLSEASTLFCLKYPKASRLKIIKQLPITYFGCWLVPHIYYKTIFGVAAAVIAIALRVNQVTNFFTINNGAQALMQIPGSCYDIFILSTIVFVLLTEKMGEVWKVPQYVLLVLAVAAIIFFRLSIGGVL